MAFPADITLGGAVNAIQGANQPGASNYGSTRDTLLLAQFGGEVAKAYEETLAFGSTVTRFPVRGKSIQLPYFGRAKAGFHTSMVNILDPSNNLLSTVPGAQRFLYVDKPLVSSFMLDEWDDIVNHLPTRQIYSEQAGQAIAVAEDNLIARQIFAGSQVAANDIFSGHPGGNTVTSAVATDLYSVCGYDPAGTAVASEVNSASAFASCISRLRVKFDEKFVPMAGRKLAMSPKNYQLLCKHKDLFDTDYTPGGNGSYADGEIRSVSGFKIMVCTTGPFENNSRTAPADGNYDEGLAGHAANVYEGTGIAGYGQTEPLASVTAARAAKQTNMTTGNSYLMDTGKLVALAWAPRAVAVANARGLRVESERKIEYGGTFVKTSVVSGCTYWMPEACGAILNT